MDLFLGFVVVDIVLEPNHLAGQSWTHESDLTHVTFDVLCDQDILKGKTEIMLCILRCLLQSQKRLENQSCLSCDRLYLSRMFVASTRL